MTKKLEITTHLYVVNSYEGLHVNLRDFMAEMEELLEKVPEQWRDQVSIFYEFESGGYDESGRADFYVYLTREETDEELSARIAQEAAEKEAAAAKAAEARIKREAKAASDEQEILALLMAKYNLVPKGVPSGESSP